MAEYNSNINLGVSGDREGVANIKVIGVGGGGCNAVDRMIADNLGGVDFIVVNTDYQVIARSVADNALQIGDKITRGLGAGADPEKGELAANESKDEIAQLIKGADMLFITAGMGGGTGTGAAPVIAKIARELGILTVAVVTTPFSFEGTSRRRNAESGIQEIENFVDSLIVVPNDKLLDIADDDMEFQDAFALADQVLRYGVSAISDLVTIPGEINLDLADVRRVMVNAGICHMGIGRAKGDNRASIAIEEAIHSPLLDTSIDSARKVIINFTGDNILLKEIRQATGLVKDSVSPEADIIMGMVSDPNMKDEIMITLIASDFDSPNQTQNQKQNRTNQQSLNVYKNNQPKKQNMPDFLQTNKGVDRGEASRGPATTAPQPQPRTRNEFNSRPNPYQNNPSNFSMPEQQQSAPKPNARPEQPENKGKILPWFFNDSTDE